MIGIEAEDVWRPVLTMQRLATQGVDPCEIFHEVLLIAGGSRTSKWADERCSTVLVGLSADDRLVVTVHTQSLVPVLDEEGLVVEDDVPLQRWERSAMANIFLVEVARRATSGIDLGAEGLLHRLLLLLWMSAWVTRTLLFAVLVCEAAHLVYYLEDLLGLEHAIIVKVDLAHQLFAPLQ